MVRSRVSRSMGVRFLRIALWRTSTGVKSSGRQTGYALEVGGWRVVSFEEEFLHPAVGEAVEEDGAGGQAVAAGAADLLVVGFDGAG